MVSSKNKELLKIRKHIRPILKSNGVVKAGIFGSYSRGDFKKNSDIDILVQLAKGKSLFDLVRLEKQLQKELGKKVDLITYNSLHPLLKERILKEEVKIL